MENKIEVSSDGINAYAILKTKAAKIGIRILQFFLILEIFVFVSLLSSLKGHEILEMIIPLLIGSIFMIGLPSIYLLWNLYGQEQLIINTKSISWSYNFGFFQTNLKTVTYDRLGIAFEKIRMKEGKEFGKLLFINYHKETNLPEAIHETTILLEREELIELNNQIHQIFLHQFFDKNSFIPFSEN